MDQLHPVYTVKTECQDCYKCVRQCPVKAIKVEGGHAQVMPELCIACGHCVEICPAHAKKVRDDLGRAKQLFKDKSKVFVSLAPSWVSEFRDIPAVKMITALKKLGFTGVSETALGAQEVSAALAEDFAAEKSGLFISSACPAVVEFFKKHLPAYAPNLTGLFSPVLAHCRLLRKIFGEDIGIVMISPCIAKKKEADRHPELLDLALTFEDLREWFKFESIDFDNLQADADAAFVPARSEEGAIYPIEGGMIETIKAFPGTSHVRGVPLAGIHDIEKVFSEINMGDLNDLIFVEALACPGGCVKGPCTAKKDAELTGRMKVIANTRFPSGDIDRKAFLNIKEEYHPDATTSLPPDETLIKNALRLVGKFSRDDELNCGGCGYESCRKFARALLEGKAEPAMCVSYLRKQAQNKANALLRCIPSGVVIVDAEMKIVECNEYFANMFDSETAYAYEAKPGLGGAALDKIIPHPIAALIENVLRSGKEITRDSYRVGKRLFNITVFNIEAKQTAGVVLVDVTNSELRREQIARRAREVINKNLSAVQEIACLLGEHMADTEILLQSIADDYPDENDTTAGEDGL